LGHAQRPVQRGEEHTIGKKGVIIPIKVNRHKGMNDPWYPQVERSPGGKRRTPRVGKRSDRTFQPHRKKAAGGTKRDRGCQNGSIKGEESRRRSNAHEMNSVADEKLSTCQDSINSIEHEKKETVHFGKRRKIDRGQRRICKEKQVKKASEMKPQGNHKR